MAGGSGFIRARSAAVSFNYRTWFSWLLLAILFIGPFVTINGNPLLLLNVVERKFVVLGHIFWPQDMIFFALVVLLGLVSILVFTTAFGRLWCGWACPQTVFMEMVFRKLEYAIEGDAPSQRALNQGPWNGTKVFKKLLKHGLFFGVSFLIGNLLLSYIIGWRDLYLIVTDPPARHFTGLMFMLAFALLFYGIYARFREQMCTFICPYGRLQSLLVDDNTILVAYDHRRGEKRAPVKRGQSAADRQAAGLGSCVSCHRCVTVCPTGIDIRNGVQMECVQCTACVDACDTVMDKLGAPRGLIRYASANGIERKERLRFTPRLAVYSLVLMVLASVARLHAGVAGRCGGHGLARAGLALPANAGRPLQQPIHRPPRQQNLAGHARGTAPGKSGGRAQRDGAGGHPGPAPKIVRKLRVDRTGPGRDAIRRRTGGRGRLFRRPQLETLKTAFIGPRH